MNYLLAGLDAQIGKIKLGDGQDGGVTVDWLTFEIPGRGTFGIPFHDGPSVKILGHAVWHRESGSDIGDITLSPSYHVPGHVHGWIKNGAWVDCGDI